MSNSIQTSWKSRNGDQGLLENEMKINPKAFAIPILTAS